MKQKLIQWWNTLTTVLKKRPKTYGAIVIIVVIIILIAAGGKSKDSGESYVAKKDTVVQSVSLSGTVEAVESSNLGFADGGRVARVYVKEGDSVSQGQLLAQLDVGDLAARLRDAQAGVVIARQNVNSSETNVENVIAEQDAILESARRTVYSNLVAVPDDILTRETAPVISGTYVGTQDGVYKIEVYGSNTTSGASFRYSGLESGSGALTLNTDVALGTKGLFIRLPADALGTDYIGTKWTVELPNKRSSGYAKAVSDYQAALKARDRAIADAKADTESGMNGSIALAKVVQAEAQVEEIQASIARRSIRAPFAGVVGTLDLSPGESVSSNTGVLKLIGKGAQQIVLQVPELDIASFKQGQKVVVTFDAVGGDFAGTVSRIDPGETVVDGVPVYYVDVVLDGDTQEVRSGMTARVSLETRVAANVIAVPKYFVQIGKGAPIVFVEENGKSVQREVSIGIIGTNGLIEITSGLNEGEKILPLPVNPFAS